VELTVMPAGIASAENAGCQQQTTITTTTTTTAIFRQSDFESFCFFAT